MVRVATALALLLATAGCLGGVQAPAHEYSRDDAVALVVDMNQTDARELTNSHWTTLRNTTSYRGRYEGVDGDEQYSRTATVDRRADRFVLRWHDDGREGAVFENRTGLYRWSENRSTGADEYERRPSEWFGDEEFFAGAVPLPDESVLVRYDFEYVGRADGGYVFEADGLVDESAVDYGHFYWDMADATNASARLVLDQRGFVRSFSSTVTLERQGSGSGTVEKTFRIEVWAVGDARAERPAWVGEAA